MTLHQGTGRARGLAAMSLEKRREIASKGGRTSQARGTAHQWTPEEASAAGKKGSARYALRREGTIRATT
jgi:general stress protein YciG